MTPQEFKAWFDGFTEALEGTPSEKQWDRIKARVAEINGVSITYPVYIDRYWNYPRPYPHYPYWYNTMGGTVYSSGAQCVSNTFGTQLGATQTAGVQGSLNQMAVSNNFDSTAAMYAAGRADADQIN